MSRYSLILCRQSESLIKFDFWWLRKFLHIYDVFHVYLKGTLSHLLQEYAKSVVPRKLDPVPEEMETNLEVLPTPPSQIQENERTAPLSVERAALPSVMMAQKLTSGAVLKRIKPQVPSSLIL